MIFIEKHNMPAIKKKSICLLAERKIIGFVRAKRFKNKSNRKSRVNGH
jgi:hypothetical protein